MDLVQADAPEPTVRRRSWRLRLALVGLALVALVLLLVGLTPLGVSTFGRGRIERAFASRYHGRLELESLDLAWTGRQRIEGARLLDPEGAEVGRATLELPGLAALLWGRGRRLGQITVDARAELVAADDGVTNLDRALRPRGVATTSAGSQRPQREPSEGGGLEALEALEARLDLRLERLSWSDATTRAAGGAVVLEGFAAQVALAAGGSLDAQASGRLSGSASGELALSARVERPFAAASDPEPPRADVEVRLRELPLGLLDNLARQDGRLTGLLGERLTLVLTASGTPQAGEAVLELVATRARTTLRARLVEGVLRASEGWALEATSDLDPEALQRLLAGVLPQGVVLARTSLGQPLRVAVPRLSVPLAAALDARARGGDVVGTLLSSTELGISAALGGWALVAPQWLGGEEPLGLGDVRVELRLVPTGGVARGDVELRASLQAPGAGTLALSAGTPDVHALLDAAGGGGEGRAEARVELRGVPTALAERLADVAGTLGPALGDSLDLEAVFDGTLLADGGRRGRLQLGLGARGRQLTARVDGSLAAPADGAAALPALEVRGEISGLALAYELLPPAQQPLAAQVLGETLSFDARSSPTAVGASALSLALTAARLQLSASCELSQEFLRLHGEPGLTLSVRPTPQVLATLLAERVPAGASLALSEEGSALTFTVGTLEVPLGASAAADQAALLRQVRGDLALALPALVWRQPPAAGAGEPLRIELTGTRALVSLTPESGLTAHLTGAVSGQEQDGIDLRLLARDPAALLTGGDPAAPVEVQGGARGLPTALVDAFAAQEGLLVDVLGPRLDLELSGRWPDPDEPLRARLSSGATRVELAARIEDGVLVATGAQGLKASTPLSPLYSQRIVGRLVPLVVGLSKPEGAPPVGLEVSDFTLPLDGDLSRLDANVRLDLNQVVYQLLPGLEGLGAAAAAASGATNRLVNIPPLTLQVRQGVVRYERLPLELGGQSLVFRGSFDLATLELDLATELPLSALGTRVSAELEKVREYVDPAIPVPLELKGPWSKPRLSVGKEFLETALKSAAQGALERGLKGLLERRKKDG